MKGFGWLVVRLGVLVGTYYVLEFATCSHAFATIGTIAMFLVTRKMAKDFPAISRPL